MESGMALMGIIEKLSREQSGYLHDFFRNCPAEVIQVMQYVKVSRGQTVLLAGRSCEYVWIVIKGEVSGEDIQMTGNVYSFFEQSGISIIGDYELFAGLSEIQKTVAAGTDCEAFRIPSAVYMKWMEEDKNALFMRAQVLARTLAKEISNERKYLLLNARDRLVLYLTNAYGKWGGNGECIVKKTQAQLAQRIGMNVRTVQRSILRLEQEGFISYRSGVIHISWQQYEMLREYRDAKL